MIGKMDLCLEVTLCYDLCGLNLIFLGLSDSLTGRDVFLLLIMRFLLHVGR